MMLEFMGLFEGLYCVGALVLVNILNALNFVFEGYHTVSGVFEV